MHPSRIFDKPLGFGVVYPPLRVVGILPDYVVGEAYEGRLDIIDNIGDCTVELLDNNLPPGTTVTVDNLNMQVVVKWPAYSPPATEHPGIINWDFQEQTLEGWVDRRGNSWHCENSIVLGTSWATDGNYVGVMRGIGRGDHILESILYPATPGQSVMARSLWDQGPSNKDNNNLWTGIGFFRADGSRIEPNPWHQWYGDRIHDRTNKSRHWSTANVVTPPGAAFKTVQLIAHRRNGRNRWIAVDSVQTSGFEYATGTPPTSDDFYLTVKVTDSANRVAYWTGIISTNSVWLTSAPYPIIQVDSFATEGWLRDIYTLGAYYDFMQTAGQLTGITLAETVVYKKYDHPGSTTEAVATSGQLRSISLVSTVQHVTYNNPPESIQASGSITAIALVTAAAYVTYNSSPESVQTSGSITGITLT